MNSVFAKTKLDFTRCYKQLQNRIAKFMSCCQQCFLGFLFVTLEEYVANQNVCLESLSFCQCETEIAVYSHNAAPKNYEGIPTLPLDVCPHSTMPLLTTLIVLAASC